MLGKFTKVREVASEELSISIFVDTQKLFHCLLYACPVLSQLKVSTKGSICKLWEETHPGQNHL